VAVFEVAEIDSVFIRPAWDRACSDFWAARAKDKDARARLEDARAAREAAKARHEDAGAMHEAARVAWAVVLADYQTALAVCNDILAAYEGVHGHERQPARPH
jgi:hypothetical protein